MAHPSTRQGTAGNDAIPITDDADLEEAAAGLSTQIPAGTNLRQRQPPTDATRIQRRERWPTARTAAR
jgi:hypothetical protein